MANTQVLKIANTLLLASLSLISLMLCGWCLQKGPLQPACSNPVAQLPVSHRVESTRVLGAPKPLGTPQPHSMKEASTRVVGVSGGWCVCKQSQRHAQHEGLPALGAACTHHQPLTPSTQLLKQGPQAPDAVDPSAHLPPCWSFCFVRPTVYHQASPCAVSLLRCPTLGCSHSLTQ